MDREKAIEILTKLPQEIQQEICKECYSNNGYDELGNHICLLFVGGCGAVYNLNKVKEAGQYLINHEQDILKEFVEWLKYEYAREEHFEMKEAKDCQQKEYTYLYEYHRGREAMAEKIRDMLDQDLKKFMEERK